MLSMTVAKRVIVAFCDISLCGPRVLHSLELNENEVSMQLKSHDVIPLSTPFQIAFKQEGKNPVDPITIDTYANTNTGNIEMSLVSINVHIAKNDLTPFVKKLITTLAAGGMQTMEIICSLHFTPISDNAHVASMNGFDISTSAMQSYPKFESHQRITDSFLSTLLHFLRLAQVPALLITVSGFLVMTDANRDGSLQGAQLLSRCFSPAFSFSHNQFWSWKPVHAQQNSLDTSSFYI